MWMYLIVAVRNILQARRRTALLSVALAFVSCFLVLMLTLSAGMTDTLIRSSTTLTAGHVNVGGFFKAKPADVAPIITGVRALREIAQASAPDVDYVIDRNRGWAKIVSETRSLQVGISGIEVTEESRLLDSLILAEEREYKEGGRAAVMGAVQHLGEKGSALLFAAQAKRLEIGVGDVVTIVVETMTGATNTGELRVVAIAKDVGFMSNWSVFVPKQTLRELYQLNDDASGVVMVYLKDHRGSAHAMDVLRRAYIDKGFALLEHQPQPFWMKFEVIAGEDWTGQKLDLTTWEDEVGMMKWTISALDSITFFLLTILVLIVVVGIMNAMWISVRERTREVGTLRAIGMSKRRVLVMFVTEAAILGFCASLFGGLLGAAVASAVDAAAIRVTVDAVRAILMSDTLHMSVSVLQVVFAVTLMTLVTTLSALWPATRASRLQPVTAIHHAG